MRERRGLCTGRGAVGEKEILVLPRKTAWRWLAGNASAMDWELVKKKRDL